MRRGFISMTGIILLSAVFLTAVACSSGRRMPLVGTVSVSLAYTGPGGQVPSGGLLIDQMGREGGWEKPADGTVHGLQFVVDGVYVNLVSMEMSRESMIEAAKSMRR